MSRMGSMTEDARRLPGQRERPGLYVTPAGKSTEADLYLHTCSSLYTDLALPHPRDVCSADLFLAFCFVQCDFSRERRSTSFQLRPSPAPHPLPRHVLDRSVVQDLFPAQHSLGFGGTDEPDIALPLQLHLAHQLWELSRQQLLAGCALHGRRRDDVERLVAIGER